MAQMRRAVTGTDAHPELTRAVLEHRIPPALD